MLLGSSSKTRTVFILPPSRSGDRPTSHGRTRKVSVTNPIVIGCICVSEHCLLTIFGSVKVRLLFTLAEARGLFHTPGTPPEAWLLGLPTGALESLKLVTS